MCAVYVLLTELPSVIHIVRSDYVVSSVLVFLMVIPRLAGKQLMGTDYELNVYYLICLLSFKSINNS